MGKGRKTTARGMYYRKGALLQIRLAAEEKKAFVSAAEVSGLSLSAWIRNRLSTAARKELAESPSPIANYGAGSKSVTR